MLSRKKCSEILEKENIEQVDIYEFLIHLHLVLESAIHIFFRRIMLAKHIGYNNSKKKEKNRELIDNIGFIDKVVILKNISRFKPDEGEKYDSAISDLINFAEVRNKLLHSHKMAEIQDGNRIYKTRALELLSRKKMDEQIKIFKKVMVALNFYYDYLELEEIKHAGDMITCYLDAKFLDSSRQSGK